MSTVVQGLRDRLREALDAEPIDRVVTLSRQDALSLALLLEHAQATQEWLDRVHGFILVTRSQPSRVGGS